MPRVPQRYRVLQHALAEGHITRLDAATQIGCFELASRIGELEAEGVEFARRRESSRNRFGEAVNYTVYTPTRVPERMRALVT